MALIPNGDVGYNYYGVYGIGITGVGSVVGNDGGVYPIYGAVLGVNAGSTGTVTLSNNTTINLGSYGLVVGLRGRGTVTIGSGSIVNSLNASYSNVEIGRHKGSVGAVTVTGVGSQLNAAITNLWRTLLRKKHSGC